MKNLLVIVPNDNLGGAEQFLKMIAESFNKSNYFVDVFFLKMRISGSWDTLESENFKLHFTKNRTEKFGVLSLLCKLLISKNKNYDYVFTSHIHLNSFVDILRRLKIINCKWHIA